MIDSNKIRQFLKIDMDVFTYDVIPSTNEIARQYLVEHPCDRAVFIARGQTSGKGRFGRNFYSPADTGIYMTYVFRVEELYSDMLRVTTASSVAVAKALNCGVKIKWVNDLYYNEKKICGILTETVSLEHTYVLIGVGINLTTTIFPDDIKQKAGALGLALDKEITIAAICNNLAQVASNPSSTDYLTYYRSNLMWIGKAINYIENGKMHSATIKGIGNLGELLVIENNIEKHLYTGDISICCSDTADGGNND